MPSSDPPRLLEAARRRSRGSDGVLVVGDDRLASQHLAEQLVDRSDPTSEARWVSDYPEAVEAVSHFPPALVVVDQMVDGDDALSGAFLRFLSEMGEGAPRVILLRYAPTPVRVPGTLDVTVVAGKHWFEELIETMPPFRTD